MVSIFLIYSTDYMETQGLLCSNPHCSVCLIEYNSAISTTHLNHVLGK